MSKELGVETGKRHVFALVPERVELRIEWPAHLVDRLPDDFKLTLTGPQIPTQERQKSDASRDEDLHLFEFEWEGRAKGVQLEASGSGQTVVLWRQQVAGNLAGRIDWAERLHPLLAEHPDFEAEGEATGAANVADDLRAEELQVVAGMLA